MKKILQKLNSIRLCMEAHPDNEPDSEFADRIEDLKELPKMIEDYTKNLERQIDVILSGSSHDLQNEYADKWIKMESEEDLPKDGTLCWFNDKKDGVVDGRVSFDNKQFILESATHCMPIIKPEPPKED